jgi:UDP-N-acetylmuramoyl-L-alanyl-D-glutamate--2,6-diaminopimelate ligase
MSIKLNSQKVKDGDKFFCLEKNPTKAKLYIANAIKNGAAEVVTEVDFNDSKVKKVEDVSLELKSEINEKYSEKPKNILTVTGTNGKTSTAYFVFEILKNMGINCFYVGTIGIFVSNDSMKDHFDCFKNESLTTPDIASLHGMLNTAKTKCGCDFAIFESSSHGLAQDRIDFLDIKAAGYTNLTQDHFDYHKTEKDYYLAKRRLFDHFLKPESTAVLNLNDSKTKDIISTTKAKNIITYGSDQDSDIQIVNIEKDGIAQQAEIKYQGKNYKFKVNLIGEFQIYNLVCSIGLLLSCGVLMDEIIPVLPKISSPIGRLEYVGEKNGARFFVDFSHTPDGLEKALKELRIIAKKKLICIFGCGGDRDPIKRPQMGEVSTSVANLTIVTDDNPRSEDPEKIREEIIAGIVAKKQKSLSTIKNTQVQKVMLFAMENDDFFGNFCEIGDRAAAIKYAFEYAKEGDIVVVCGKGHENYQIVGDKIFDFSDQSEILKLINV